MTDVTRAVWWNVPPWLETLLYVGTAVGLLVSALALARYARVVLRARPVGSAAGFRLGPALARARRARPARAAAAHLGPAARRRDVRPLRLERGGLGEGGREQPRRSQLAESELYRRRDHVPEHRPADQAEEQPAERGVRGPERTVERGGRDARRHGGAR